ncbi:patatin-like phospholipase family protein [Dyella choica]|uniref:Patatin n=1 Tax=Dyella choica TaxID=1927959 RepID=A0A3S0RMW0_9GAMM|nr:patatin-like phospholipase family protein [Dyella choica]RUL78956.1 patatin [Dyella choica]
MDYKILSLDGGGSWALIQVKALIDLYNSETTGHTVLRDFDMVAANSGGSIVLGGLVANMKLGDLLAFFKDPKRRESIFVKKWPHPSFIPTPRYRTDAKLGGLKEAFPRCCNLPMQDAVKDIPGKTSGKPVHLLIIGFDYDRNRARFFRSAPAQGANLGSGDPAQVPLVEAIHASSTAPVLYFDQPAVLPHDSGKRYWDGGVTGCNNPVLAAVTEAMVMQGRSKSVIALSIGTGTVCLAPPPPDPPDSNRALYSTLYAQGVLADVRKLASAIVDDPPDSASFIAHVMAGAVPPALPPLVDSRIVRMNPMVSPMGKPGNYTFPAENGSPTKEEQDTFTKLVGLDMDAIKDDEVEAIETFTNLWLKNKARNQAIRMKPTLERDGVGHELYLDAKEAWRKLGGELPGPPSSISSMVADESVG